MIAVDSAGRAGPGNEPPLATLCYQSRAIRRPSPDDLSRLLTEARARNRQFGVTGMLVHEGDRYFQWLEGPGTALAELWSSIRRDDRHSDVELLGEGVTPTRLFAEWDLRYLHRPDAGRSAEGAAASGPAVADNRPGSMQLAELALAADEAGMEALVQASRTAGAAPREICRQLLEPAAHQLGDWWCEDRCDSFAVSLALAKLQNLARTLEVGRGGALRVAIEGQKVLISPSPRETHLLGATLLGGFFRQAGWSVQAEFPKTDAELMGLVHTQWFDAIALTLSDVFTRRERLAALVKTIADVRAASRNPTLTVLVGGRAFRADASHAADRVGADVHYASAGEAVSDLDYWLFMHRFTPSTTLAAPDADKPGKLSPIDVVQMITPALSRRLMRRSESDSSDSDTHPPA